jgi:hypothetical protein
MEHNVVIKSSPWTPRDLELMFDAPGEPKEPVIFADARDLPNLLVQLKCFKSTGEARRAGRVGPIPLGFTELKANKKTKLWIWNPSE